MALNTFREAVRNRAFVGLAVVAAGLILASWMLGELAVVGQAGRVVVSFGFFAVSLFAVATAVVMGALLLHKELERKTIFTIVSKPVHRVEVLLGKFAGILGVVGVEVALLGTVWGLVVVGEGGGFGLEHLKGLLLIYLELMVVAGLAVMFSALSSPVFSAVFTAGGFAVGRVVYVIDEMVREGWGLGATEVGRWVGGAVVGVFPDLSVFNISQQVMLDIPTSGAYLGEAAMYALAYTLIFLGIGVAGFQRRDFV
jgi:ABC-type transport system involved in multi-copper enzyme maturation permease subunit